MGKLSEVDKSNIHDFLKYDDKKITSKWVYNSGFINILISIFGADIGGWKPIYCFIAIVYLLIFITLLLYFHIKITVSKMNLYLFYGINMTTMSLSCCYLSCLLFNSLGSGQMGVLIPIFLVLLALIALFTIYLYQRAICNGKFSRQVCGGPQKWFIVAGVAVTFPLREAFIDKPAMVAGVIIGMISLILSTSVYFFLKFYCYYILANSSAIGKIDEV